MKKDIIISGVGGQGIVSIAAAIGLTSVNSGLHLKQSEVHGMSQRGGEVQSHLRLSDREIASDLIPYGKADIIISIEPMEGLRYLPMLRPDGWLITNICPYVNIANYPDMEKIIKEINSFPNHIALDADAIAKSLKSAKSSNIVMLGAALPFLELDIKKVEESIMFLFKKKGEFVQKVNIDALHAGLDFAEKHRFHEV